MTVLSIKYNPKNITIKHSETYERLSEVMLYKYQLI